MRVLRRRTGSEGGSLPVALLAAIVVAGIATVLTARMVAGERAVRFDRSFTQSFHTADAGIQQAVFQLNAGVHSDMEESDPPRRGEVTFDDDTYVWELDRSGPRSWTVTSTGTQNDVSRTVQAHVDEKPLFYPGAFGDTLIAFNGNSTNVDSYNSDDSCTSSPAECGWGTDDDYGTGNGSIATNGDFDFSGTTLRPGSAFLYDWEGNRPPDVDTDPPFGSRCEGGACTETYVSTVDEKLDYASESKMAFIFDALADCDGAGQELNERLFGGNGPNAGPTEIGPYEADPSWTVKDATDPAFENYYCADNLQFLDDTTLTGNPSADKPVVIFVRDFVLVDKVNVACPVVGNQCKSNKTAVTDLRASDTRPEAARLQVFVAGEELNSGKKGANVTYNAQSVFAGVVYGPRSRCGSPGGAGVDIFGAIICGSMDNVGNWRFHYDDQLGKFGSGLFGVGYYSEEPSLEVTPSP